MQHRRRLQIFQAAKRAVFSHAHPKTEKHIAHQPALHLTTQGR